MIGSTEVPLRRGLVVQKLGVLSAWRAVRSRALARKHMHVFLRTRPMIGGRRMGILNSGGCVRSNTPSLDLVKQPPLPEGRPDATPEELS